MNNDNQNNEKNNYVIPESVDLSKVNVDTKEDNSLNRERDNIISASIQANQSINEESAIKVNDSIKVEKRNPIVSLFIGILLIGFAAFLAFLGYKLLSEYIKKDDTKYTTTTTTTHEVNHFYEYISNFSILRKFQNDNNILILLPRMSSNIDRYIYFSISSNGIINKEEGTYNIKNEVIGLASTLDDYKTFILSDKALVADGVILNMYDQEVKYYRSNSDTTTKLLIINGTSLNEIAYYYEDDNYGFHNYIETGQSITLDNGQVFTKTENDIINNGETFKYVN